MKTDKSNQQTVHCDWGIQHFLSLPLSERLTDEEKKQIKEEYTDNLTLMYQADISYVQREIFTQRNNLLEEIFGKEIFKK